MRESKIWVRSVNALPAAACVTTVDPKNTVRRTAGVPYPSEWFHPGVVKAGRCGSMVDRWESNSYGAG